MNHRDWKSILFPLVIVPAGGLLALGICYLLYYGVYMLVEGVFYADDPTLVPAEMIRLSFAILLLVVYLVLQRLKVPDLLKAVVLIGPLTMFIITAILGFYLNLVLALSILAVIAALCLFLLYRYKKPWFYYYAAAISVLAGLFYAWPRN